MGAPDFDLEGCYPRGLSAQRLTAEAARWIVETADERAATVREESLREAARKDIERILGCVSAAAEQKLRCVTLGVSVAARLLVRRELAQLGYEVHAYTNGYDGFSDLTIRW